ncbi:FKBP-type peptidyl-prolyl cis-trans isomerase [Marinigracilibium pacificum]|uniref:Peptidyl-prolyl cis-trans isomerase n=1 Tax=Marinigracilibium pacificum TaxID=2729599 RepID=A0A848J2M2_9BACT|nr:FKBP-type peptidyl-prolyl cis-trans isomerase [Marinigracilibium pacificum]NMM47422.1 hypothetical protein [Marinigracilibium pacificum]
MNKVILNLFFVSLIMFSCGLNVDSVSFEEALEIRAEEYKRFADNNRDSIDADVVDIEAYLEQKGVTDYDTTYSGVRYYTDIDGTGPEVEPGSRVAVYYELYNLETGQLISQSRDNTTGDERVFVYTAYAASVIQGFDEGIEKLRQGDEAHIFIPSDLGYGENPVKDIPGNTNLYYFIKVRQVQ